MKAYECNVSKLLNNEHCILRRTSITKRYERMKELRTIFFNQHGVIDVRTLCSSK